MLLRPSGCLLPVLLSGFPSLSPSSHRKWFSQPREKGSQNSLISPFRNFAAEAESERMYQGPRSYIRKVQSREDSEVEKG